MNADQNSIRKNRSEKIFAAAAAALASTLVLSSVLWLFVSDFPASSAKSAVAVQQHAAAERA